MGQCHNHHACKQEALHDAESICAEQAANLTPIRKRVLELVWQSHKPIKAYDVLAQLQAEMPSAKPPTVYRALDFLLEHHLVHKLQRLNAFIGCHHPQSGGESCYFLICTRCEEAQELHHPGIRQSLHESMRQQKFLAQHVTVEVEGICKGCLAG